MQFLFSQPIIIALIVFVVLYFCGRYIPPVRDLYGFIFGLLRIPFLKVEQHLSSCKKKPDSQRSGLASIMRLVAGSVALIGCGAEAYSGIDASVAVFGGDGADTSFLPQGIAAPALGCLLLCLAILFGMTYFDAYVPVQARLFQDVDTQQIAKLKRLSFWCLVLSVIANLVSYLCRSFYLIDKDSMQTHTTQFFTFVLLGVLVPLMGMLAWYFVILGIEVLLYLLFSLLYLIVRILDALLEYIGCLFVSPVPVQSGTIDVQLEEDKGDRQPITIGAVDRGFSAVGGLPEKEEKEKEKSERVKNYSFSFSWQRVMRTSSKAEAEQESLFDSSKVVESAPVRKDDTLQKVASARSSSFVPDKLIETPPPASVISNNGHGQKNPRRRSQSMIKE